MLNPTVDLQQTLSPQQYTTAKWEITEAANRRRKHVNEETKINVSSDKLISETISTVVNY